MELIDEILEFWFGKGEDPYEVDDEISTRWFAGGAAFDAEVTERFGDHLERAICGEFDSWRESPRARMALILLFDQFSRHIFRDSPRAWSQDLLALNLTLEGIAEGHDRALRPIERTFFYLPLEHAEDLRIQELSVQKYKALAGEVPNDPGYYEVVVDYAVRHHEIVEKFGRFPHRNEVIGRPTSPEEAAFLKEPNSSF